MPHMWIKLLRSTFTWWNTRKLIRIQHLTDEIEETFFSNGKITLASFWHGGLAAFLC